MGKIVSIANQKGGVGKTTTAINLSACLSNFGKKTLLIDIDPQGNTTSGIGIDKNALNLSIYDLLINEREISDIILPSSYGSLYILPSNADLTGAEVELTPMMARDSRLKNRLGSIKNQFDFIIIDCPPSLGLLTINALTASDSVIIPLQCEYYALEGLSQLITTIDLVKKNLNPSLEIEGVLLTMCDYRTNLSQQVTDDVRNYFKEKSYNTVIPRSVRLSEAPGFGRPIIYYDDRSIGARSYIEFTKEFLQKNGVIVDMEVSTGVVNSVPRGNGLITETETTEKAEEAVNGMPTGSQEVNI